MPQPAQGFVMTWDRSTNPRAQGLRATTMVWRYSARVPRNAGRSMGKLSSCARAPPPAPCAPAPRASSDVAHLRLWLPYASVDSSASATVAGKEVGT